MRPHLEGLGGRDNRIYAAKQSFMWFILLYLNHFITLQPADFQIETWKLAKTDRLMIVMPRGFGKSIIWSICYPLWVLLTNPYGRSKRFGREELVMLSNTSDLAEKWVRQIKTELMYNELIVADFHPKQGEVWRNDEIDVEVGIDQHAGGKLIAKGSGAQIRGWHPSELLVDDLEKRDEAAGEQTREKMREYFYQDLWGVLNHRGDNKTRVKMIGTFVHPLALLVELYGKGAMGWTKRKFSVYKPDGSPLWPERMDEDDIDRLRDEIPPTAFASEYLNQPIVSENPIFIAPWMKKYTMEDEQFVKDQKGGLYTAVALDPAISRRDGADYSAITTISATYESDPRYYVRQGGCLRGHWPLAVTVRKLRELYNRFNVDRLIIETVSFQKAFADEFRRECDREGWHPRIVEIRPDKDKERRANQITGELMRGRVLFDRDDPSQKRLIDELLVFPTGDHDDLVDAFVYALNDLRKWAKSRSAVRSAVGPNIVLPGRGRRNRITGVC